MYKFKFRQSRLHKGKGTKLHYTRKYSKLEKSEAKRCRANAIPLDIFCFFSDRPQLYAVILIFLSILQQIYWEVMKLLVLLKSPLWSVRRT